MKAIAKFINKIEKKNSKSSRSAVFLGFEIFLIFKVSWQFCEWLREADFDLKMTPKDFWTN